MLFDKFETQIFIKARTSAHFYSIKDYLEKYYVTQTHDVRLVGNDDLQGILVHQVPKKNPKTYSSKLVRVLGQISPMKDSSKWIFNGAGKEASMSYEPEIDLTSRGNFN